MFSSKQKTVILALSGGIDSAVSALLLKKQNYKVICIFLVNWDSLVNDELNNGDKFCSNSSNYKMAKMVASHLNLEFHKFNFEKEYWNLVFLPFIDNLKLNYTPNPDIFCNELMKFNVIKNFLLEKFNAKYFATGHYAKIENNDLLIPKDTFKDQTYFLSRLSKINLKNTIFPLNNLLKSEVRKIAVKNNFPNINEKESMGICFIGKRKFSKFLINYLPILKGDFVDFDTKKKIGEHKGYYFYTIDQRKGIGISSSEPYFVYKKNRKKNIVYLIKSKKNPLRITKYASLIKVKFIDKKYNKNYENIWGRFRHGQKLVNIFLNKNKNGKFYVYYHSGLNGITPGQICAFYLEQICIGSGIVYKTFH